MKPDLQTIEIKRRLRTARLSQGLSQKRASTAASVSKTAIETYESQRNERIPTTRQLFLLAEAYEVSIDWLLCRRAGRWAPTGSGAVDKK
jgi:transcriptional regulator with XRE-family HTH domain